MGPSGARVVSKVKHILNLYEDLELPLSELCDLIDRIDSGLSPMFEEKLDGQNFTFTRKDGRVRMLGKGIPKSALERGGYGVAEIRKKYEHLPVVRDMFVSACESLEWACRRCDKDILDRFFKNGALAVECALIDPANPNVIRYGEKNIVFLGPRSMTEVLDDKNWGRYADFVVHMMEVRCTLWKLNGTTFLKGLRYTELADAKSDFDALVAIHGLTHDDTVGDLCTKLVRHRIDGMFQETLLDDIAHRLVYGDKSKVGKKQLKSDWKRFQAFEKNRDNINEALIPLERIIQLMGVRVIDGCDFKYASNSEADAGYIRDFVTRVRKSYELGLIDATPRQLEQIRVSLKRIDESLIRKPAEGVVFHLKGKPRKLVGMFAPLNRLYAAFKYPDSQGRVAKFKSDFIDVVKPGGRDITATVASFRDEVLAHLDVKSDKIVDDINGLKFEVKSGQKRDIIIDNLRLMFGSENVREDESRLLIRYPLVDSDESIQVELLGVSL